LKKNASRKKVIIINTHDKIDILKETIRHSLNHFGADTAVLCFKSRIPKAFGDFAGKVTISEDYLTHEDYLKIDDYVFNGVSKNWDRTAAEKSGHIFTYRGIKLARIAEYGFQQFLIARIKALAVFDRAIKKENYKAAFIIDSNEELGRFERLIFKHYHIPAAAFRISVRKPFIKVVREKITSLISGLIDRLASLSIQGKKRLKLVDARLFYQLDIKDRKNFILAPFEKGIKLRLRSLLKNGGYVALDSGRTNSKRNVDMGVRDAFIFEGIPYWEVVEDKIGSLVRGDFAKFRKNIDILSNIHKAHDIKSIILRNDVKEMEKTAVLWAKKNNIPTLVVQHGILAEYNGHDKIFADKIAVWGSRAIRWYEKFGNDPGKIIVVGNPNFDKIPNYEKYDNDEDFMGKLRIRTNKRYLVTLITPCTEVVKMSSFETDDITYGLIEYVSNAVKSIGDINLVVKLHPNENLRAITKLVNKKNKNFMVIVGKTDLHKLIGLSDLVVVPDSTVGLEALIMKKPVVALNLGRRPPLVPYAENNVAIGGYKIADIESAIKNMLHDDGEKRKIDLRREDFINDFAYKVDGGAKGRILNLIEKL
jgi:glycosyltransferase involved in cell wall biosynthesis